MHILVLPSWYPVTSTDINGIFFREQVQALHRSGHRVGVIDLTLSPFYSLFRKNTNSVRIQQFENDGGVHTYRYHSINWLPQIPYGKAWLSTRIGERLFKRYVTENGCPDIIHAHSALMGGLLAVYIGQRYNVPVVLTEHSTMFARKLVSSWQKRLITKVFKGVGKRIAVSPQLGKLLEKQYPVSFTPWIWIPNMIDQRFTFEIDLSPHRAFSQRRFRFCNIALLTEKKGHKDLLIAFKQAFKDDKEVELCIGGDGPIRNELVQLANKLGISKRVIFLGLLSRDQVLAEIQKSDAFVLPSHYETFGVVVIEALACGKPVIATTCGGPECVINEKNGLLVPPRQPKSLADAMLKMYYDYRLYDSKQIRRETLASFSEASIVLQLTKVYQDLLCRGPWD